jgi:hypothetical protein
VVLPTFARKIIVLHRDIFVATQYIDGLLGGSSNQLFRIADRSCRHDGMEDASSGGAGNRRS